MFGRYRVYGETIATTNMSEHSVPDQPRMPYSKWAIPRPWATSSFTSGGKNKGGTPLPLETFWKRTIPYVSLCLDQSNRNILVDSIINNIYVKVPEKSLSAKAILSS